MSWYRGGSRIVGSTQSTIPNLVQYVSKAVAIGAGGPWTHSQTATCNFPNPARAGNCLVLFLQVPGDRAANLFTATDNIGSNTWVSLKGSYNSTGDTMQVVFYALNVAAGTQTVVMTQTTGFDLNGPQWMGAEFCNVTALDTSASTTGNSSTMTTGSATPTVTGDLVVYAGVRVTSSTVSSMTAGSQSNITWKLLGTNIFNGHSMQWGVYNSTAALNAQMTMASSTEWAAMALYFKAGAQGSPRPSSGIYVVGNTGYDYRPGDFATTQALQLSAYGNLRVIGVIAGVAGNAPNITNVTDSDGNAWTASVTSVVNDSRAEMWHGVNAPTNTSSVITLTLSVSTGDFTAQCLDIIGAAASPFDAGGSASGTATGTQSVAGNNSPISVTPSTSNGLIYVVFGVAFNTNISLTAPIGGSFLGSFYDGQSLDGPSTPDENNGWAIFYNPDTSARTFTFHMKNAGEANGQWAAAAACFKAA